MSALTFVYLVVILAFVFDFINGFHDAANSIATIVSTGVLKPWAAVIWAAFFNCIACLFFHLSVANTVGVGLISPHVVDTYVIMSALIGAITFNLFTWYFGLPSSSSHALIGGLIGAALAAGGVHSLNVLGISKVLASIFLSPLLGFLLAWLVMSFFLKLLPDHQSIRNKSIANTFQLVTSAMLSIGHGGNDAQKTMGIIAVLLFSAGLLGHTFSVPFWVVVSCNLVMGLGTLAGGWRIVHTLGKKITPLNSLGGGCSSVSAAVTLFLANHFGIPVSTTHTVTGAITGVGSARGGQGTDWTILKKIAWAWAFTIPCAGIIAFVLVFLRSVFH
jgi:PiT family inorganic phosphate transporter